MTMLINIPDELSLEVANQYSIKNNTFIDKETGEICDKYETEIGDVAQQDFLPQLKIKRWDNECNFSVRLVDDTPGVPIIDTEKEKIKYVKEKIEVHFYKTQILMHRSTYINGYEFEVILKEKPATNMITYSIQTKGLRFVYQPPLTEEWLVGQVYKSRTISEVTETEIKDSEGNILLRRPENVIKSWAVYNVTSRDNYSLFGGKDYKTGKAFHRFRPKAIDANGWEVWGDVDIDIERGLSTVTLPQDFIDNAVYPIRHASGDTFGYTSIGASTDGYNPANDFDGCGVFTSGSAGTATSISIYHVDYDAGKSGNMKGVLILDSDYNIISNGVGSPVAWDSTEEWVVSSFGTSPSIAASTDYVIGHIVDTSSMGWAYDSDASYSEHYDSSNNYASPTHPTDLTTYGSVKMSIYVTYTPSAGGLSIPIAMHHYKQQGNN